MSAQAMSNQIPINNTKCVKVPPGNETGLYYILLSNLPFQTSWQQLKDHVRAVCPVERVEVFNESTTGWVMVRGRENFDAALGLLEGGLFNGRPTFADGRNADHEIMIKELVGPSSMNVSSPRSPRTPRHISPPSMQFPTSIPISSPSAGDYSQYTTAPPSSFVTSPTLDYTPHHMGMSYNYGDTSRWYGYDTGSAGYTDMSSAMPPYHQYDTSYQPAQQYSEYHGTDYTTSAPVQQSRHHRSGRGNHNTNGFVQTEQRKIIIKGLTTWTTAAQLEELVRSRTGLDSSQMASVSLPLSSDKNSNKGYGYVTFASAETASAAVGKLHNYEYDGKRLRVGPTKEGVTEDEASNRSGHHHKHHREDREKKQSSKASSSSTSDKKDKSSSKKGVVIANGSSKKAGESSKKH